MIIMKKKNMFSMKSRWMMVTMLSLLLCQLSFVESTAQPKQRRNQQTQQAQQGQQQTAQSGQGMTQRMRIQYPTALDMPEDVVWRRDIYREIDLTEEANAGLYYPAEPIGRQLNLFTYVFKLALNGYISVYEYNLDGNEVLEPQAKVDMKSILDNYHIYYEEQQGKLKVDNSDIPSPEVKMYYLKESAYYDQANSTFHIKPLAFCPVMVREDDFGGEAAKYPLFWVKYSDVEPFLSRQTVLTSDRNDAAVMTLDDYFTLNKYRGKIYKTNNRLGRTLAQVCEGDTAKLSTEQKRIEAELTAFRNGIFGDPARRDSLDSIANLSPKKTKASKRSRRGDDTATETVSSRRNRSGSSSSGSAPARVSVRRERH